MFVSDSHKVVFIHIQKTGGLTVDRLLNERIPDLRGIVARHGFASQGMDELDEWDEYFKFAFVRNPWDRLVSWYSMVTTMPREGNDLWRYVHDNSSTFEEFIYNCTDEVEIKEGVRYSFAYNQLDYVTDEHGNLLVDFIGRLENFDEDLQEVFRRIGFELETVPHKNRSGHRHYSTFYTPETEMIVRERFKRDIDYFGYEFERPHTALVAELEEKVAVGPRYSAQKRVEIGINGGSKETGAEIRVGRTSNDVPPKRTRLLFVCGCDRSGTTVLADYLNRHPEILICQETFDTTQQGEITPDLATFERMLDCGPKETEDTISNPERNRLIEHNAEILANKNRARLRWIGASNSDYMGRMESVAGNNPGVCFIVIYRPIKEIAESGKTKGIDVGQAVKTWNRDLQGTRRFIRDSLVPRVLVLSYHDFLYRTETVVPLISRFLGVEFDESGTREWADERLQFEKGRRTLEQDERSLIQKQANRRAEAWILARLDKQWKKPALYVQESSNAKLATSLDEMEAKTWRLQQRIKELERDIKRRRRRFKQLMSSRTWKLLNRISGIRARIVGR